MLTKNLDLALIAGCTLALMPVVYVVPGGEPIRVALGLPFILFSPGYVLVAALFPRREGMEALGRLALSIGLSAALVPLIGLILNYLPWGIRLHSVLPALALFIALCLGVALYRRRAQPPGEAFAMPLDSALAPWRRLSMTERTLAGITAITVIGLGVPLYIAAAYRGTGEGFTEFYILGPEGRAEGYPRQATVGQEVTLMAGVLNREGKPVAYRVVVMAEGRYSGGTGQVQLPNGERWEGSLSFTPTKAGSRQKLEFLLFKEPREGPQARAGWVGTDAPEARAGWVSREEPYRSLYIWVDVKASGVAVADTPSPTTPVPLLQAPATPSPTPQPPAEPPEPPPAPSPTPVQPRGPSRLAIRAGGPVYATQPGDDLEDVAARFGLSPEAILAANGMAGPGPLSEGQELVVPGTAYRIQPGDTLSGIAAAFGVSQAAIVNANGIANRNIIYWGQILVIPKAPR